MVAPGLIIELLQAEMQHALRTNAGRDRWGAGHGRFFLDGFPRDLDQAKAFEAQVVWHVQATNGRALTPHRFAHPR
jgi:adenylate kinase family enzyme